jgi:methionine biosynthesis protein MetW
MSNQNPPSPVPSPDENSSGFLDALPSASRYDYINEDPHEVAALLASFIPKGARVLDVGCGTGSVSSLIQRFRKAQIVGIEPDADRVQLAKARGLEVMQGYLTPETIATLGRFDAVVFADVLEHVPNPSALLKLGCSALRPGGCVALSVPNIAHWSVRWELLRGRFDYEPSGIMDATHLRWFTAASMGRWLRNSGLDLASLAYSAGTTLPVYERRLPWRKIERNRRYGIIRRLNKAWPKLFGCQLVVRATPRVS